MIMNKLLIFLFILTVSMIQITAAVNTFPQIITETHNQTLNLSSTAILTCHILDLDEHHVTWFKLDPLTSLSSPLAVGKQLFTNDKRYSVSFYSTSKRNSYWSLEIYQLNFSDEGTYICKIANRKASVSISIHLHIQIPMIIHPTTIYAEPDANIKINCSILMNNESSSISWLFSANRSNKSKPQDVYIRKKISSQILTSYLIINHAQVYHTGLWTCVYKGQRLDSRVTVEKDVLKHQRASALLSSNSNRHFSSINLLFLLVYYL